MRESVGEGSVDEGSEFREVGPTSPLAATQSGGCAQSTEEMALLREKHQASRC